MNNIKKKTKIIATLGPATEGKEMLEKMIDAGVNVFRINMSHGNYEVAEKQVKEIRELSVEKSLAIGILLDLQGPKIRLGIVEDGVRLEKNEEVTITTEKCLGTKEKLYLTYKDFPRDVKNGEKVLIDDGNIVLETISSNLTTEVKLKVIQGGEVKSRKGVNLPNTRVSLPALTEKDIEDAKFAAKVGVDWLALSFVRNESDLVSLKELMKEHSPVHIPIVAKIEKPEAISNIDEIIDNADAIMVARGDLGIEIPIHHLPMVQKDLVKKARAKCKPVIIATQMLESMTKQLYPTRAEVSDVANAVMDGVDAVMLSGETSVGDHPEVVVQMMKNVILSVEGSKGLTPPHKGIFNPSDKRYTTDLICHNACNLAVEMEAKAILTLTNSGYTGYRVASYRSGIPILVFTSNERLVNQLSLVWGVSTYIYNKFESTDNTIKDINKIAKKMEKLEKKDCLINMASMPIKKLGMVNTLRVSELS